MSWSSRFAWDGRTITTTEMFTGTIYRQYIKLYQIKTSENRRKYHYSLSLFVSDTTVSLIFNDKIVKVTFVLSVDILDVLNVTKYVV